MIDLDVPPAHPVPWAVTWPTGHHVAMAQTAFAAWKQATRYGAPEFARCEFTVSKETRSG